eukprot:Opistho-2@66321
MASIAISAGIQIALAGAKSAKSAKANQDKSGQLGVRLETAAELLTVLKNTYGENIPASLQEDILGICACIKEVNEYVQACDDENGFTAFFKANSHERQFYELDKKATLLISNLTVHCLEIAVALPPQKPTYATNALLAPHGIDTFGNKTEPLVSIANYEPAHTAPAPAAYTVNNSATTVAAYPPQQYPPQQQQQYGGQSLQQPGSKSPSARSPATSPQPARTTPGIAAIAGPAVPGKPVTDQQQTKKRLPAKIVGRLAGRAEKIAGRFGYHPDKEEKE